MLKEFKLIIAGSALLTFFTGIGAAMAGGSFTVVNRNSGKAIERVWFANAGESGDPWKEAILDYAIRPRSCSNFSIKSQSCFDDIKVRFSDGYVGTFSNVDVCRRDRVLAD